MKQNSNFHSHCTFCDGRNLPEEFVKAAITNRFRAYGFSSHSPLPFETTWNMAKEAMPDYLATIKQLKEKYAGEIELYLGLEIDYLDETYNAAISYFQSLPLDYRISAIHFLPSQPILLNENSVCIDGPYRDFEMGLNEYFGGDIRRMTESYFASSMQMVEMGGFDIVGHIDKVYMNGIKYPGFDIQAGWYQKPFLQLLDLIAEKGCIVEINCKTFTRNGQTFPHTSSFPELCKRNIPVIVNSDCHQADLINNGRAETLVLLKDAGYKVTTELVNGTWQEVGI